MNCNVTQVGSLIRIRIDGMDAYRAWALKGFLDFYQNARMIYMYSLQMRRISGDSKKYDIVIVLKDFPKKYS